MSLFDRSFIITTGITAVICGALFYYFNTRVRELELALARQSQVLSSFISNVQQEFRAGTRANELASPEAIRAVNEEHKKIIISDSECDSEDSDDDSVSDNDDENVSDNDDENVSDNEDDDGRANIKVEDNPLHDSNNKLVICDLPSFNDTNDNVNADTSANNDIKLVDVSTVGDLMLSDDDSDEDDGSDSDNEFEHVKNNIKIEPVNIKVEKLDTINITEVNVEEVNVEASHPVNYNDLKVDELRKIVVDKGLAKKEEAKKLKKNELLTTLLAKEHF